MPYRMFRDSDGGDWAAWDVLPASTERRVAERRTMRRAVSFTDRRRTERRVSAAGRPMLGRGMSKGWLCFEGADERRRLTPIPDDWARCPVERLQLYCRVANPVERSSLRLTRSTRLGA